MAPTLPRHELSSPQTLAWIGARLRQTPSLSRYQLAKDVCTQLNWRDPAGRLREMAARKHLLALHRDGRITLPPARCQPPKPRPPPAASPDEPPTWPSFTGPLAEIGPITLQPVAAGTEASRRWNAMMQAHHPQGRGPLCGAQIRYLIVSAKHGPIGGLAVSAAAWRLRARDSFLGWTDAERAANLAGIVCNSRFLILPGVQVKHLASHVLGKLARQLPRDWRSRYAITPWLMETCVEVARSGTAYRAANWMEVGLTAGRGRQDTTGKRKLGEKRVFLYPLSARTLNRLCPRRTIPPAGWVRREFGGAKLGDSRLAGRLLHLAGAFYAQPQANIPQACGSAGAAKAAYRFFDNKRVTMDALLEPHHQATIDRIRRESLVLVAQDTSSLNYTGRPDMKGIGPISNSVKGPQGIEMHSALAFRPDGLPLGILDIECWHRKAEDFGKRKQCNAKPIEQKESFKWLRALRPIGDAAKACPATRIVTLADRESDIYEYMLEASTRRLDIVLRAKEKYRSTAGEGTLRYLWPQVLMRPLAGVIELAVPRRYKQPARMAGLALRFAEIDLQPPQNKPDLAVVRMWVVLAREEAPPPHTEALEWMLLTSVPVAGLADAVERIQWYAARWGIEVFHRILKSGCQIEERQLGTADRLEACLAIDAVVAWRIHHLTFLGRATPDLPCTAVFEDDQWKAITVFKTRRPPPETPPSLREMIRAVAQLGGFLARKSDGEPGSQVLWRGLQRMDDITIAFRSYLAAFARPP
ncbi:MAG: IS4 family transposase [Nevskiales bacterium]